MKSVLFRLSLLVVLAAVLVSGCAPAAAEPVTVEVTRVVEDMFSIIIMARAAGSLETNARAYLRWELGKEQWARQNEQKKLLLRMPPHQLILMK